MGIRARIHPPLHNFYIYELHKHTFSKEIPKIVLKRLFLAFFIGLQCSKTWSAPWLFLKFFWEFLVCGQKFFIRLDPSALIFRHKNFYIVTSFGPKRCFWFLVSCESPKWGQDRENLFWKLTFFYSLPKIFGHLVPTTHIFGHIKFCICQFLGEKQAKFVIFRTFRSNIWQEEGKNSSFFRFEGFRAQKSPQNNIGNHREFLP
jgi:hypothetical protein